MMKVPKNFDFSELKKYDREFEVVKDYIEGKLIMMTVYFQ